MSQFLSVCFLFFGNKMSSNSVFRMLKILFGGRLELGFKSFSVRSAHIGKSLSAKRFFNLLRLICIYAGFMRKYTASLYDYSLLGLYLMLFSQFKTSVKD